MEKKDKVAIRHTAIKELLKSHAIEDQKTLVQLIQEKYGIETNQSIISRDLRELGVTKSKIDNKLIYEIPEIDASREILRLGVRDVVHNETLIIVRTLPGLADFVGDFLDMYQDKGILATVAGENVVFVAPTSTKGIKKIYTRICSLLHFKQ